MEKSHHPTRSHQIPTLSWVFAHHPGRLGKPEAAHGNPSAAGWMRGVCSSAGFGHLSHLLWNMLHEILCAAHRVFASLQQQVEQQELVELVVPSGTQHLFGFNMNQPPPLTSPDSLVAGVVNHPPCWLLVAGSCWPIVRRLFRET